MAMQAQKAVAPHSARTTRLFIRVCLLTVRAFDVFLPSTPLPLVAYCTFWSLYPSFSYSYLYCSIKSSMPPKLTLPPSKVDRRGVCNLGQLETSRALTHCAW